MIPSDPDILKAFPEPPHTLHIRELLRALDLPRELRPALRERLRALADEGRLERVRGSRYGRPVEAETLVGTLTVTERGHGYVSIEGGAGPDVYVDARSLGTAMHRDRVRLTLRRSTGARVEGQIVDVLERGTVSFVGTFRAYGAGGVVHPQDPRLPDHVTVEVAADARDGDLVAAELVRWPTAAQAGAARVLRVLTGGGRVAEETEIALYDLGLRLTFPAEVEAEAEAASAQLSPEAWARRQDLRDRPLVTVDPESARDFDDAVHARPREGGGWVFTVAIADVGHYVTEGSALDQEAYARATSVYFPDRVVPMLPHRLSSDLCSLRPDEERPALVAEFDVEADGTLGRADVYEAVIKSHARFTYERAARMLGLRGPEDSPQPDDDPKYERLRPMLSHVLDGTRALRASRRRRGYLELETPEPRVFLDAEGNVEDIRPAARNEAHRLIEEAMLAANEVVARRFVHAEQPAIFRVHDRPDRQLVERFRTQAESLGAPLRQPRVTPAALSTYLRQQSEHPERNLISLLLLRSMAKAVYEGEVSPHFGLGAPMYLHFTSPIRRYPDLVVHRLLKAEIHGRERPDSDALAEMAAHCSRRERAAVDAERTVLDLYKAVYLSDHVGEEHDGTVHGVTSIGLFVHLDAHSVEGLIHVERLEDDYYVLDEETGDLVGRHTGNTFRLGDRVRIRVADVDVRRRRVDFSLVRRLRRRAEGPERDRGVSSRAVSSRESDRRGGGPPRRSHRSGRRR